MNNDYYQSIVFPLTQNLKMRAKIESLRFEKQLYDLNIEFFNKKIQDHIKLADECSIESVKESLLLNIQEFEVRLMEFQTKKHSCNIQICRQEYNLKNYKEF